MSWFNGFEPIVQADVPLAQYVWYRLGGPARWLCEPRDENELAALMRRIREHDLDWRILGAGANVIVRDAGFDGPVIRLVGPIFENVGFDAPPVVNAGAGADFPALITAALKRNLIGLEAFAGIPGTVGGIVRQNAGGRYGEIGAFVQSARVLNADASIHTLDPDQIGFQYRHTNLAGRIVLSATFALRAGNGPESKRKYREIFTEKQRDQPALAARCAGCIFKNPPQGPPAGRLLDEAGLKGQRVGGAEISARHANFILAHADATADDVLKLISLAKERVLKTAGIELQPEVDVW